MAPPSERAPICGALHALRDASDDVSRAAALVALHDATVVALWAVALHADGATPDRAMTSAHPFFGAQPDREARLVRFAEANPVAAIGAGLAAELLSRETSGEAKSADTATASKRWLSFGDAPLDVIEREVFAPDPATSAPAPASPRP
jgi:gamma-glutamyl:cysteine ligase YbdK (ATP-grasp superfamily)